MVDIFKKSITLQNGEKIHLHASAFIQSYRIIIARRRIGENGPLESVYEGDVDWTSEADDMRGFMYQFVVVPGGNTETSRYDIKVQLLDELGDNTTKIAEWSIPKGTESGTAAAGAKVDFS